MCFVLFVSYETFLIAGVAFEDRNIATGACINTKVKCEILEEDFEGKLSC